MTEKEQSLAQQAGYLLHGPAGLQCPAVALGREKDHHSPEEGRYIKIICWASQAGGGVLDERVLVFKRFCKFGK